MSEHPRQFGIDDPDQYWRERVAANRDREKPLHRYLVSEAQRLAGGNGVLLDCGVGDGHVFRLAAEAGLQAWGVEQSAEAIASYDFDKTNIVQADLNDGLPELGTRFDIIVISMVLHWLREPEEFLRGLQQHLTETGRLLVVIPNITLYRYRLGFLFGKFPPISASHSNFMTPVECEAMFEQAGYRIERVSSQKKNFKTRLCPKLFSADLIYQLTVKP